MCVCVTYICVHLVFYIHVFVCVFYMSVWFFLHVCMCVRLVLFTCVCVYMLKFWWLGRYVYWSLLYISRGVSGAANTLSCLTPVRHSFRRKSCIKISPWTTFLTGGASPMLDLRECL